jgi:hypothetical protein
MYPQIFVTYRRDMRVSLTESSRKTGRPGRRKSTGTTKDVHARREKEMVVRKVKTNKGRGEVKENRKIKKA